MVDLGVIIDWKLSNMLLKQLQNGKKYMISVLYLIAFMEKLTVTLRILLN